MDLLSKFIVIDLIFFFLISAKMVETSALFKRKNGKKFSIFNFEFPQSADSIKEILNDIEPETKKNVIRNLNDDYLFMIAAYVGVALLCYKAREFVESNGTWYYTLTWFARLQVLSWIFDIIENVHIKKWVNTNQIPIKLNGFKVMVFFKFLIAGLGAILALIVFLTSDWCTFN